MFARSPQPATIQLMSDHGIKVEEFLVSEEIGVLGKTLKVQESACAPPRTPPLRRCDRVVLRQYAII